MSDILGNGTVYTETFDCLAEADANADYSLRIGALFAILSVSFIGSILPWVCRSSHLQTTFFFASCFAGGVVVATGFVHILGDAAGDLGNPCLQLSTEYPWAFTFCGGSVLFTFAGEYFLRLYIRKRYGLSNDPHAAFQHEHDLDINSGEHLNGKIDLGQVMTHDTEEADPVVSKRNQAEMLDNKVAAIMLEAGVIFHSIFVGLDLGINQEASVVRPLMIALMFHQGFEGLALGTSFIRAKFSTLRYMILATCFVLVTPIGIAIGIGVSSSYQSNGQLALGFEGGFNSLSSGILIYNGLVDLLLPAFTSSRLLVGRTHLQLFAMFLVFAGYTCMAFLAKWA